MDRAEAIDKLKELSGDSLDVDVEIAHVEADAVLCSLLISLGYQDVISQYALVPKWYA
jgi:hypothetical protein